MSEILNNALTALKEQEEKLKFEGFNNEEAWKLGCFMVEKVKERGIELAICIRKPDGNIVFQYASEGTDLSNQEWMGRKANTVLKTRMSSLRAAVEALLYGNNSLDSSCAGCGGGFPIRVKGDDEIKMILTVSYLPHVDDHGFIIDCLSEYLGLNVSRITDDIPMLEL